MQQRCVQVEDWLWHNGLGRPIFSEWWHICNFCFFRFHKIFGVWNTDLITMCLHSALVHLFLVNLNLDIEHLVWSWRDKNRYISDFCVCVIMSLAPSSLSSSGSLSQFQIFNLAPTLFSVKSEICFQNQINSRRLPHWHLDCHKSRRINTSRWLYHHLFHLVTTLTAYLRK